VSLKNCPDCGSDLGRNATKCRCGWKTSVELPRLTQPCAHEGCKTPAILREQIPTGWANFCEYHYIRYHRERAELWCNDHGLYTLEQRKEFCRKVLRVGVFKRMPTGDDE